MNAAAEREEAIFYAALKLPEVARAAFLEQECGPDTALLAAVQKLLRTQAEADQFFSASSAALERSSEVLDSVAQSVKAAASSLPDEQLGTRIGRYKLLQRIGEGGCGVVYMAEQEEPVRRKVALKVIKLGMDTKNVIARFEAERQALALMDHPNIAQVLDAGATETGRPFFVMELVRGIKITDYCDQNQLSPRARLKLFVQICQAIQHAHQKGIIHRDIKPSNILVTLHDGVPVPKVIDFGIAKATNNQRLTDKTLFTPFEQFIGTPAYMSPEQAELSGLDVDTRSDIYSLGVLLYALLTGRTPFDAKKLAQSGFDEMRRTIREAEPQRPSQMVTTLQGHELTATAAQRCVAPPNLISLLKGDLDWIVMKALEKDRTRRYETANGLAMDVLRYLDNEPVKARPPSRRYRLEKMARRNRGLFAAIAAVLLALIAGFGTSTWLFFKERTSRREAEMGRANEAILRRQAEAREKITGAANMLGQNRFEEADRLISEIPVPDAALEGAPVFRSLGDRAALLGHWKQAADRFLMLVRVNQVEAWDVATLDHTRLAVALVEARDHRGYERFRQDSIAHFSQTLDPIFAERIVKNGLLLPADENTMASLAALAEVAAKSLSGNPTNPIGGRWMASWRCVSLALMDYRRGRFKEAIEWCKTSLMYSPECPARVATLHTLAALSYHELGQAEIAQFELAKSREMMEGKDKHPLEQGNPTQGFWFDWVLSRVLLREAEELIETRRATPALNPQ